MGSRISSFSSFVEILADVHELERAADAGGEVGGERDGGVAGGPEVGGEEDRSGGDGDERRRDDDHRRGQVAQHLAGDRAEAEQGAARLTGGAADDQRGGADCQARKSGLGGLGLLGEELRRGRQPTVWAMRATAAATSASTSPRV